VPVPFGKVRRPIADDQKDEINNNLPMILTKFIISYNANHFPHI